MKPFSKSYIILILFPLVFVFCFSDSGIQKANGQLKPYTCEQVFYLLRNTIMIKTFPKKFEDIVFNSREDAIEFVLSKIKNRKVDQPCSKDNLVSQITEKPLKEQMLKIIEEKDIIRLIQENIFKSATEKNMTNSIGMKFVKIPMGNFIMGSDKGGEFEDETPTRKINIKYEFYVGIYEVTIGEWKKVMGEMTDEMKNELEDKFKENDKQPVVKVSWDDAKKFIEKLNQSDSNYKYRLLSEAEWEYVARAKNLDKYAFGSSLDITQANFNGTKQIGEIITGEWLKKTQIVGKYKPNDWGVYDMHGNAAEWVEDVYHKTYQGLPSDGSPNLDIGEKQYKVIRGGSWISSAEQCRSAARMYYQHNVGLDTVGFRLVAESK